MRSSLSSPSQLKGTQSFLPQLEKDLEIHLQRELRPDSPALTQEQSCAPPRNSNGDWTSLGQHKRLPEFPIVTREKPQTSCQNSRKNEIPPSSQDEALLFLQGLESNPESSLKTPQEASLPLGYSIDYKRYPSQLERRAEFFASTRGRPDFPGEP